jgi:hypothetical protein
MKSLVFTILMIFVATISLAQTADNLKERIQEHYAAIHADDIAAVISHHLPEFSMFSEDGTAFMEPGWEETLKKMGTDFNFPTINVTMKHFNAQIYDNVGVATFYLDGDYGDTSGLRRVTAVWVWVNGMWKEAHHHESRLKN